MLRNDEEFTNLIGLGSSSDSEKVNSKIIQEIEPDKVLTGADVPVVCIYVKPGRFGRNHLVFEGKFCLDVYGHNSQQARQIAERAFKLFHDKRIRGEGFITSLCTLAYDDDFATGIGGIKGFKAIYDVNYHRMN
jgi:hypothetical protein